MDYSGQVIALGSFDGVHLGHQQILSRAYQIASKLHGTTAVLTYDPLPAQLIHPDFTYVLTPLSEKVQLLIELGIQFIHIVRFNEQTRITEPVAFVKSQILPIRPSAVVAGHDHRFGNQGRGDIALLRKLLEPLYINVEVVPEFGLFGAPVRSTRIREHLLLGHVRRAADLLGRHYRLSGKVITGTGIGHHIGFPTINLMVEEKGKLVPADGVYAALVDIMTARYPAVLNIGHRPTFMGETRTIEAHLLDCHLPFRPPGATVHFVERLRSERKFPTPEALTHQIQTDIEKARRLLDL